MVPVAVAPANQFADMAERHSRSGNGRTGLDPDRHRGRLHAEAGRGAAAARRLEPEPADFNFGNVNQHSLSSSDRPSARMSSSTSAPTPERPSSSTTTPWRLSRPAPRRTTTSPGTGTGWTAAARPTRSPATDPTPGPIMQIQVAALRRQRRLRTSPSRISRPCSPRPPTKRGVFEVSQDPIIVPQAAYNSAYNNTFPYGLRPSTSRSRTRQKTFQPIDENGDDCCSLPSPCPWR